MSFAPGRRRGRSRGDAAARATQVILAAGALVAVAVPVNAQSAPQRLCLAPASVRLTGVSADAGLEAVRETFTAFLAGPGIEIVPLTARTPVQVREEARLADCHATLLPTLRHERKSGGGLLGRALGEAVQEATRQAPAGGMAGSVARVAGDAAHEAARGLSDATQARDRMTLEYRLEWAAGGKGLTGKSSRQAEADGEDLLTPMVEEAAARIAEVVLRSG